MSSSARFYNARLTREWLVCCERESREERERLDDIDNAVEAWGKF